MTSRLVLSVIAAGASCYAAVIFPGTLTVPGTSTAGVSFTFTGTLTQADTIAFSETGNPCLQTGPAYCTNGAGVVVVAGTSAVGAATGFSGTFNGTNKTWTFGSLVLEISGAGAVQVFPATASNGLGSGAPPAGLTLNSTSLSSLGFSNFSLVNPTITFVMADTLYTDNSGAFTLTQASVPEPGTARLLAAVLLMFWGGLVTRKLTS